MAVLAGSIGLALASQTSAADPAIGRSAQAQLRPIGPGDVNGTITFQKVGELVRISGAIRNLAPGKHGFHVHEGTNCEQRGDHFSPRREPHGSPDAQDRHVGDLGNLAAGESGEVDFLRLDRLIQLSGPQSIVGRVLVVHQGEDDFVSQPSGDSGDQIACGRIDLATP